MQVFSSVIRSAPDYDDRLGQSESDLQFWETLPEGTELRLEVSPGLFLPKSTYIEIEGLTVRDHVLSQQWNDGEPALMPDSRYDTILSNGEGQKRFSRSWDLSGQRVGLTSGVAQLAVNATISLRFANEEKWGFEEEMDLTWTASGTVGHQHPISDAPEDGRLELAIVEENSWF